MIQATQFKVDYTHLSENYESLFWIFKENELIDYPTLTRTITSIPAIDIDNHILNQCASVIMRKFIDVDIIDIVINSVVEGLI